MVGIIWSENNMSCNTETRTIGSEEYSVTQWPAEKALLMKFRLVKIFGSSIAKVGSAITSGKDEIGSLSEAINDIFLTTKPEDLVELLKDCIILNVAVNGKKITQTEFTEMFSGDDLGKVYSIFFFVLQVNYKNFLKGPLASKLVGKAQESL